MKFILKSVALLFCAQNCPLNIKSTYCAMASGSNCSKEVVLSPEQPFQYMEGEVREEGEAYNCTYRISAFDG